ncbi:MAG: RsmB/NOP family class I SAM-dependent RNA methyltransferase [Opitutaceae bacterium]|nr:RsmB/NOP family class I SAM-dependent RNA methyltransferase [Opitutaceae bacterium]
MAATAVIHHATRVLQAVRPDFPADMALRRHLYDARRLNDRAKREVSLAVFAYFRWREWVSDARSLEGSIEAAAALQNRYEENPSSVKPEALAARAVPAWSRDEVAFPVETLKEIQREPVLWLRARRAHSQHVIAELQGAAVAEATPWPVKDGTCLRYTGSQDLFLTAGFHEGRFEIQDLASQAVGHACAPVAGQTWWDACAGEGGKTMHLADLMGNKGLIWASDRSERRLQALKRRAARAEVFNYRVAGWDGSSRLPTKTHFDGVLVDAPCSGVGTWQRNPHARWTTQVRDVEELSAIQLQLLRHAAPSLKVGGRLVYAVCTLTRRETEVVADSFLEQETHFEPTAVFEGGPSRVMLWPHLHRSNGMFIAAWKRIR